MFFFEIFFLALFFHVNCVVSKIHHNQYIAIYYANKTLSLLLKEKYEEAYSDLDPGLKERVPFEIFKALADSSLSRWEGGVKKIEFDYYLPVLGQRAIELFYQITYNNPGKELVLHLILVGDSKEGYEVYLIDFGNEVKARPNVKVINQQKQEIEGEVIIKPDTIIVNPEVLREFLELQQEKDKQKI